MHTFKVCVVGRCDTGKTTYIRKCLGNQLAAQYTASVGVEVYPVHVSLQGGEQLCFNFWDCTSMKDDYYVAVDAFILFLEKSKPETWEDQVQALQQFITSAYSDPTRREIPFVAVFGKQDVPGKFEGAQLTALLKLRQQHYVKIYEHSSVSGYNYEKPLLAVVRQLLGDETVTFA
jgi:GTPase SAR1 family protein